MRNNFYADLSMNLRPICSFNIVYDICQDLARKVTCVQSTRVLHQHRHVCSINCFEYPMQNFRGITGESIVTSAEMNRDEFLLEEQIERS